jgi:hypothetical protein
MYRTITLSFMEVSKKKMTMVNRCKSEGITLFPSKALVVDL